MPPLESAAWQRVTFVVGARPNFMKTAPVVRALRELAPDADDHARAHGPALRRRHVRRCSSTELGLPRPDVFLGVGSGTHAEQTAKALVGVEEVLRETGAELVVVPGDVNSTLAGALAGVKLRVPVAHLEAGLRSYDPEMPEEHNRRLTDHVSSLLARAFRERDREPRARGDHRAGSCSSATR